MMDAELFFNRESNKELLKVKYLTGLNQFKYIWLLLFLVVSLIGTLGLIQARKVGIIGLLTNA